MIKDTNPDHYKVDGANFIEYMNDPKISGFGNWMFANGFNSGVWASSNWISVEDRLPEQAGHRCLVTAEYADGKRTVFTAYMGYGELGWRTYDLTHMERAIYADNHVHHNYHITHWMPLPEPPEQPKDREQIECEKAVDMAEYCEMYEPTYNPEDGSM